MNFLIKLPLIYVILLIGCDSNTLQNNTVTQDFEAWLATPVELRAPLESLEFSRMPLSKSQSENITAKLFGNYQSVATSKYGQQWNDRALNYDGQVMPFYYQIFGQEPADGRSLIISLHGGGGAPKEVNDQQYENQKHLYDETMKGLEGMYLAARAPTDTWNLWHQTQIDDFLNITIQMAIALENVNPNKVYITGYSAGGDGVYQLGPRMADRWAAAAMMAGHPNDASPLSLRNTPFAIHMGELDGAYNRNLKAEEWKSALKELESNDPGAYIHDVQIHEGLGHWMKLQDAVALPWMKKHLRNPIPQKIVWKQDDRHHNRFYWLGTPEDLIKNEEAIIASYNPQANEIEIHSNYSKIIQLYVNDHMLNLDEPITIKYQGKVIGVKTFSRSILNIHNTLLDKGDIESSFPCMITIVNNEIIQE
jgi:predicted esterase